MAECRTHDLRVCVTGASGYLASWLVMRLLERGYIVRGTLRSLVVQEALLDHSADDKTKTAHLLSLPGAGDRLELVKADLLDEDSLRAAMDGCDGVFNVAVPLGDPAADEGQLIEPTITSALNVLRACRKVPSVKRVVMTSSYYACVQFPDTGVQAHVDESTWTSVEYCMQEKMSCWGYMVGKSLGEKAALEYAQEHNLDLITILPSLVGGSFLPTTLPGSVAVYLALMTDVAEWMCSLIGYMSYVHVDDVARAHILLMEEPRAKGRYLCSAVDATLKEVLEEVSRVLESSNLPLPKVSASLVKDFSRARYKINTKKLEDLGFMYQFDTLHKIFKDASIAFVDKGFLKQIQ